MVFGGSIIKIAYLLKQLSHLTCGLKFGLHKKLTGFWNKGFLWMQYKPSSCQRKTKTSKGLKSPYDMVFISSYLTGLCCFSTEAQTPWWRYRISTGAKLTTVHWWGSWARAGSSGWEEPLPDWKCPRLCGTCTHLSNEGRCWSWNLDFLII